jgi:2-methylisocitrate lyase-like PEP mutase family enzyme
LGGVSHICGTVRFGVRRVGAWRMWDRIVHGHWAGGINIYIYIYILCLVFVVSSSSSDENQRFIFSTMSTQSQNDVAKHFRSLHVPGNPIVLTNVWDAITANAIASLPATKALATASFAIAAAAGLPDDNLTLDVNLRGVASIAKVAAAHNLPLTADFQDGYGEALEEGVRSVIKLGAVGINLEDYDRTTNDLYPVEEQCARIKKAMAVAIEEGVPDFVVNARTDALFIGSSSSVSSAISRAQAYLAAGAFNTFIWGGPSRQGWSRNDVEKAAQALSGRLNVLLARGKADGLNVKEVGELGVCRISLGPGLMKRVVEGVVEEAGSILKS